MKVKARQSFTDIRLDQIEIGPFKNNKTLIVAIYVDDFLIFYQEADKLNAIKNYLNEHFMMKDIGPGENCLGMKINQKGYRIEQHQENYILQTLKKFGMFESKPMGTPSDTNNKLTIQSYNEDICVKSLVPYQEAVGSFLYIAQFTRPDIALPVNDVSRFNNTPSDDHWRAVKTIFRYLRGTANLKLTFTNAEKLEAFSDADWGSDIDILSNIQMLRLFGAAKGRTLLLFQARRQSTSPCR